MIGHEETFVHEFEGREEDVLEKLELAMVAVGHIAAEHGDLAFCRHDSVAVSSHDLPYVGILLVRHDAGTCRELIRESDEAVVRTHVHAAVGSKLVECQRYCSHG